MPLQPDTLLHDRYQILNELGHGGMGAVYRGRDDNLGVEVAVKENLFVSPEAERQFKREATLLASLRHPNLPRVTDHFVIPAQGQYLVMDFIPGEDAKQLMDREKGPLPEAQVVKWAREILDALHYLHTRPQPIVHRDIKPGNIKITPEGRAVLVDFGLAKVHDISQATTTGAKALTPGFAPPEQYGLGRTDPRTDVYSLGATLYTLLTNCIPADSIERAMGQKKLVPLRATNPAVSAPVAEAIERSMSVKPEDRFNTALEFATALAAAPTLHIAPVAQTTQQAVLNETLLSGSEIRAGRTPTSPRPASSSIGGVPPSGGTQPRSGTRVAAIGRARGWRRGGGHLAGEEWPLGRGWGRQPYGLARGSYPRLGHGYGAGGHHSRAPADRLPDGNTGYEHCWPDDHRQFAHARTAFSNTNNGLHPHSGGYTARGRRAWANCFCQRPQWRHPADFSNEYYWQDRGRPAGDAIDRDSGWCV